MIHWIKEKLPTKETKPIRWEDEGRWVEVRNTGDKYWKGPFILPVIDDDDIPFRAGNQWWSRARIVPGPGRITMQEHDGSPSKPRCLDDNDEVLVELNTGFKAVRSANFSFWHQVNRYQKLEIK